MLPTTVTVLSGMSNSPQSSGRRRGLLTEKPTAGGFAVGQSDQLVANDVVREPQLALEIIERAGLGEDLEDDVRASVL